MATEVNIVLQLGLRECSYSLGRDTALYLAVSTDELARTVAICVCSSETITTSNITIYSCKRVGASIVVLWTLNFKNKMHVLIIPVQLRRGCWYCGEIKYQNSFVFLMCHFMCLGITVEYI